MAKRANGEGTVYEDPKNRRWVGEVVLDGHRRRVTGRSKKEAAQRLRTRIQESQEGIAPMTESATLNTLIDLWEREDLAHRTIAPATRYRFGWQLGILRAELGSVRLRKLNATHIHQMFLRLIKPTEDRAAYGRSTLVALRSTLGQILSFAVGRRLFPVNVAPAARIPVGAAQTKARASLTVDQAQQLWDACASHERLGAYIRTAMLTGLRPGEVAGLTRKSLQLRGDQPTLTVSRQVQLVKGSPVLVDGVKTQGSYRTVEIPSALVPVLREHLKSQTVAHELIFHTASGGPLAPSNVRRDLAKLCQAHGLPVISPNELRHTAASLMLAHGVPMGHVAKVLGHNSTRMLERHYAHEIRPAVDDHVAAMDHLFAGRS